MKSFENMCRMNQLQLKNYMKEYLILQGYEVVYSDGFLYAKGNVPVLLVAHLDTVHKEQCREIVNINGKLSSPQGIGGDDRCGVFMIANIVQSAHCSVLLCEDEESGAIGANKFAKTEYIKKLDVNYMIELDRRGENDAVFYDCDNKEFIDFITDCTGYKKAYGTFSDISKLMPASELCGVNLSCGYYGAHTIAEYVIYDEMMATINIVKCLIMEECNAPFKYVQKNYGYSYDYSYTFQRYKQKKSVIDRIQNDNYLELEATVSTEYGEEFIVTGKGATKAECWLDLFLNNPYVCMNDISDYCFI